MKDLRDSKKCYDEIEIPKELDKVVSETITTSTKKMNSDVKSFEKKKNKTLKYIMGTAAAIVFLFIFGLNTSKTIANEAQDLPIIGSIAKVLTIRSYESHEDGKNIVVNVPEVQVNGNLVDGADQDATTAIDETQKFVGDINAEIQKIVDEYVMDAQNNFDESKKAFFETGGTEEEWADRDIEINVGYEIMYQDEQRVSFVLTGYENWVNYSQKQVFYNLDLVNNKFITLEDELGENWVEIANEQIIAEIERRMEEEDYVYWGFDDSEELIEDGFKTVDENTNFYINEDENIVIVFEKYSIGPGYIGTQEFEIIKK